MIEAKGVGVERWFEPLSLDDFRTRYLGRDVLHVPEASPAVRALVEATASWSVEELLERHKGDVLAWFHRSDGRHTSAPVSPASARQLYDAGITLYLGGVPEVRAMVDEIAKALQLPRSSLFGSLFCNKPSAVTRAHFDPVDILCIQLRGTKRWWLAPNTQMPAPTHNWATLDATNPELRLLTSDPLPTDIPEGATAYDMAPGALLHVPRGHWHKTFSPEESISLHFGYSTVTYMDIVAQAFRTALVRQFAFREASYSLWDPAARRENVEHLRGLLRRGADALAEIDAEDIVAGAMGEAGEARPVDVSTRFVRNAFATVGVESWDADGEAAKVHVNLHGYPNTRVTCLELSKDLVAATLRVSKMRAGRAITASEAAHAEIGIGEEEAAELLGLLETAGLVRRQ